MTINTRSQFFYDLVFTENNNNIEFNEGGSDLTATIDIGSYTVNTITTEVARAMNEVGANNYVVTVDRSTRLLTIAGDSNFSLLVSSSSLTTLAFDDLGFTGSDRTSANSYEGDSAIATVFRPQQKLQSYVDSDDNVSFTDGSVKQSTDGTPEVVSFGKVKFFEMEMDYINDYDFKFNTIETNTSAVSEARAFMNYAIEKRELEFMPDRDDPDTFFRVLLESTPESRDGIAFKLKEAYDRSLVGFFRTGKLVFRRL